jgi:uncharacterized protein (TIGR03083 family)
MAPIALRDPTGFQDRGLAGTGRENVLALLASAWDDFIDLASSTDLTRRTRLPGWRARDVAIHLGVWEGYRALDTLIGSAREGGTGPAPDVDASNAAVIAAHRDATPDEVLAALRRHRDDIRGFADEDPDLDDRATMSIAGRLPLLTVLMGEAYELAVHALDLHSAGGPPPPPGLLQTGIAALADVTGALAAATRITGSAVLFTPEGGWEFESCAHGWTTTRLEPGKRPPGAGVSGAADVLLDASSGRNNPVTQLARRRLRVHDLPGLLRLTPIVEVAPNIPGGAILRFAARTLSGGSKRRRD